MIRFSLLGFLLGGVMFGAVVPTTDALAARTLIVYATNSPDSVAVKDHYVQARFSSASAAHVCPITLPNPAATDLTESEYNTAVQIPVQQCLTAAGKTNILYIVLAYVRPFRIYLPAGNGAYALDSYLADLWNAVGTQNYNPSLEVTQPYYAAVQSLGQYYPGYQPLATYRAAANARLIYSVWRLDGATPAIAMGLVDKATAAMNHLSGGACIDEILDPTSSMDNYYRQGDWDLQRAAEMLRTAGLTVTVDSHDQEFGTAPALATCPADGSKVALYSGWYSLNNYNGASVFQWAPGAIGWHLDSGSALDPRGGANWSANALLNGIAVTSGAVAEPYLEGMARPDGVVRDLLQGATVGDAFLRNTRWLKWMILNIGDPLYRPFPATGMPHFNPPPAADSFRIAKRDLVGGNSTTGTITLAAAAPAGGLTYQLTHSPFGGGPAGVATSPASVVVAAGSKTASFTITAVPQSAASYDVVIATSSRGELRNSVEVDPLLSNLTVSAASVAGTQADTATLYLNGPVPAGGATILLASSNTAAATVPSTLTIGAGATRAAFRITTHRVTAPTLVTITATYQGVSVTGTLTVH